MITESEIRDAGILIVDDQQANVALLSRGAWAMNTTRV